MLLKEPADSMLAGEGPEKSDAAMMSDSVSDPRHLQLHASALVLLQTAHSFAIRTPSSFGPLLLTNSTESFFLFTVLDFAPSSGPLSISAARGGRYTNGTRAYYRSLPKHRQQSGEHIESYQYL